MREGWRAKVRPLPLGVGLLLAAAIALLPSPLHRIEGFGDRPALAAAVSFLMAAWWFTDALPMGWTACLPLLLFPLLNVFGAPLPQAVTRSAAPYLDAYIFMFFGGMVVGTAMELWGLHRRIALHIMRAVGTTPRRLLFGVLVSTAAISMWISNTATAVMMLPIGMALIAQLEHAEGGTRLPNFGAAVMLSIAFGANLGGIGTKIGTPTNSVFLGFLSQELGMEISFLKYAALSMPFVALMLPLAWWVLWQLGKRDRLAHPQGREVLDRELTAMGPLVGRERQVAVVFAVTALLWILADPLRSATGKDLSSLLGFKLAGKHYEAGIALLAAGVIAVLGAVNLQAIRRLPWSTLLLMGGSFAMAEGISGSGLAEWMALQLSSLSQLSLFAQIGLAAAASVGLSAVASNTATINVMLNVLPRSLPVLFGSTIAASCDFALPAGTPPNAIVFGSGYIRLRTMMKVGGLMDLIAVVAITLYIAWVIAPLLG